MKLSDFDFNLPPELIADYPANPRDSSRLLVADKKVVDKNFSDLPEFLLPGDVMVFNDTKVIPARLIGKCGNAKVEVTLHKKEGGNLWRAFAKPAKKMKVGEEFIIAENFSAMILEKNEGEVLLDFGTEDFSENLHAHGFMPLPPYIKREGKNTNDEKDYQTIFAREEGAVAAPTAGLHFTENLLRKIKDKDVNIVFVTLHVGAGTFLPVKTENIKDHKMHSEFFSIGEETAAAINNAHRIIAVGTTSLRVLETAANQNGLIKPMSGETDIFITPGYEFKTADVLLTNFHLPKSTLFMLVSAFAGCEKIREVYSHAIENRYRFFSYGDACLLFRHD